MNKKIKKVIIINTLLIMLCTFGLFIFKDEEKLDKNSPNMDLVHIEKPKEINIESESYSYLPSNVQEYIEEKYNNEGIVILTEKNKIKNESYLNPRYVEYMQLSEEEKSSYGYVPEILINDYMGSYTDTNYPSTYNLVNTTTSIKDQGQMGLCWAFAANSSFETALYKSTSKKVSFSERQLDYVTATPGEATRINKDKVIAITEQYNPYNTERVLGEGGNFTDATQAYFYGLSPVESSTFSYENNTYNTKNLSTIFSNNSTSYAALSSEEFASVNMYELSKKEDLTKYNNVINYIKKGIMEHGSFSVGTAAPQKSAAGVCYNNNNNLNLINYIGSSKEDCPGYTNYGGHAMAIIGWNDDFTYAYCVNGSSITADTKETCAGKWISGKGAWILRNSWGTSVQYPNLAYSSAFFELGQFTGAEEFNYDNSYDDIMSKEGSLRTYKGSKELKAYKSKNVEKLTKVSFKTSSSNNYYDVYVSTTGDSSDLELVSENIYKEYPGMLSVKLNNITLSNDTFLVKVVSKNRETTNIDSMIAFTNNATTITGKKATTPDIIVDFISNVNLDIIVDLYTKTNNINNGDTLKYIIKNSNDEVVNFTIGSSYVLNNKYITTMTIPHSTPSGIYSITTLTSDNVVLDNNAKLKITVKDAITLEGSGTSINPYILKTPNDFNYMNQNTEAYYKLQSDIDFTDFEIDPIGNETSPFKGHFDGNNHIISNLNINSIEPSTGLFEHVKSAEIKNIIFKDVNIIGNDLTGTVAGILEQSTISNIKVVSGYVQGANFTGAICGRILNSTASNLLNKVNVIGRWFNGGISGQLVFSNLTNASNYGDIIGAYGSGGLIGESYNNVKTTTYEISNSFNVGDVYSSDLDANGGIVAENIGGYNFKYLFNAGKVSGKTSIGGIIGVSRSLGGTMDNVYNVGLSDGGDIIGSESPAVSGTTTGITMKNIYYIDVFGDYVLEPINITKISKTNLKSLSNMPKFDNTKWIINNNTYPTLISNPYYFVSDVSMADTKVRIGAPEKIVLNIIPNNASNANFSYTSLDETIFDIDNSNNIVCAKAGTANLKISVYDGYNLEKNIAITCDNEITNVELINVPTKLTYKQLEQLDVTGGKIRVTYDDETYEDINITKDMVTNFNSDNVVNSLELTITYLGHTVNYNIKVEALKYNVTHNDIASYTLTGENTVNYNTDYTFTINVNSAYSKVNMKVLVNDTEVTLTNNSYTISKVKNNINIVVSGLVLNTSIFTTTKTTNTASIIPIANTYKEFSAIDILNSLNIKNSYVIKDANDNVLDNVTYLGTGMKIAETSTYTVIIRGELTGDGKINQGDVAKLYNYYKAKITLNGYFLEAAKIRGSDTINQGDVAKLYNYYKNKIVSLEGLV